MTMREYQCSQCKCIKEVKVPLAEEAPFLYCSLCGVHMRRYFGNTREVTVNFGFRPSRYPRSEDERIAQYQFENL
jgi:predicted nucleic acid-binding Zn ribbon protein